MKQEFYSNGKLLITGEYVVLEGALALALPTKYGQKLTIKSTNSKKIQWESLDNQNKSWFKEELTFNEIEDLRKKETFENPIKYELLRLLREARNLNPNFLRNTEGLNITTHLNFPKNWGLGSSSTLINNIATWAQVDAFKLSEKTFGGSGYDIAAAQNNGPIIYSRSKNSYKIVKRTIDWSFKERLFFIYLNKKQNSRDGILDYHKKKQNILHSIQKINAITDKISNCKSLTEFEILLTCHEKIISEILQQKTIKQLLFKDFPGLIKSLGAWGGDFVLVSCPKEELSYFRNKGFTTILNFHEMML